jgi:hypothetical protein
MKTWRSNPLTEENANDKTRRYDDKTAPVNILPLVTHLANYTIISPQECASIENAALHFVSRHVTLRNTGLVSKQRWIMKNVVF